jgi:hypothetical protein
VAASSSTRGDGTENYALKEVSTLLRAFQSNVYESNPDSFVPAR